MTFNLVSGEDYASLLNFMSTYQHLVDDGDEDGWTSLFAEDGVFAGLPDDIAPGGEIAGREALKHIPRYNVSSGHRFRHNLCSLGARYGQNRDEVFVRYYMLGTISPPGAGTTIAMQVDVRTQLVRTGDAWQIKRTTMDGLT